MPLTEEEDMELWREQCREQLRRSTDSRLEGGLIYVYRPVLDDVPHRVFDSMDDYRLWCKQNLAKYLGYGPPSTRLKKLLRRVRKNHRKHF